MLTPLGRLVVFTFVTIVWLALFIAVFNAAGCSTATPC